MRRGASRRDAARQVAMLRAGVDLRGGGGDTAEIPATRSVEIGRTRLVVAAILFGVCFLAVAGRLVDAMVVGPLMAAVPPQAQTPEQLAAAREEAAKAATAERTDIVDRNGMILATSVVMQSLAANPREIIDVENATAALMSVLPELSAQTVRERLSRDKEFVWLARYLTPSEYVAVHRLGIPGFEFRDEPRRVYPQGSLTSHVVGYTDIDGHGLAGAELSFDDQLAAGGRPVALSLDVRVQHILREELAAGAEEFRAIGASGMVMDINTGEVLAMVSLPDFDPSQPITTDDPGLRNRNTLGVYEMGSVFKVFNTAMALDAGLVNLSSTFDASRPLQVGRFTIHDFHPEWRPLNVAEILLHSSNIGSALIARLAGTERQRDFMERIGMLQRSPIELPDASAPIVPSPWRDINVLTIAFGHGLAVSPIHVVSGYAAMANGGRLVPATITLRSEAPETRQVISAETSEMMRRLMRMVVADGSQRADAEGYLVGGKTGTANKPRGGGYSESAVLSSFIGVFPMHAPRYVVLVTLDEPKGNEQTYGFATGGWVSAPVVSRVVSRIGPLLGVMPADADNPAIREALRVPVAFE